MKITINLTYPAFAVFALVSLGRLSQTQAVVPAPDGGYPNFTTAAGDHALQALTLGVGNTAIGTFSLFRVSTGNFNTAVGAGSLDLNQADSNTATGAAALLFNSTGTENTAVGAAALEFNDSGNHNNAVGAFALFSNTVGFDNTATGASALQSNIGGSENTASGSFALQDNTGGSNNTANGYAALFSNITGDRNTAIGNGALFHNTNSDNTAVGANALDLNSDGANNTAVGSGALSFNGIKGGGNNNVAVGFGALEFTSSGIGNIALGTQAGVNLNSGNDNIYIKSQGPGSPGSESNTIRIGFGFEQRTFMAGISGVTVSGGSTVFIKSDGQLGVSTSSGRFKDEIRPMDEASEVILALKPVRFRYKKAIDPERIAQFGLVAEEVEKVNPDLVVRDKEGKPYSVRYDQVNAMLLNEFLKEHRKVRELEAAQAQQQNAIKSLTAMVKEQAAQIQKVSAPLELNKPAPQTVLVNR